MERDKNMEFPKYFGGVYPLELCGDRTLLPWGCGDDGRLYVWFVFSSEQGDRITISCCTDAVLCAKNEGCIVLMQGECVFSKDFEWILPESVLNIVKNTRYVWIGLGDHFELVSEQLYQAHVDETNLTDLMGDF